jgi:hypothetical protein
MKKSVDLKVFITNREASCKECGEELGRKAWITLNQEKGPLCLSCSDLDHLVFLPAGDAALTRRARKHSVLSAVVLRWSRARKRYERQGLLVEDGGLEAAEKKCLEDSDARERRRERQAEKRAEYDQQYIEKFTQKIKELFPSCPPDRAGKIAQHACLKYSGRVGRSAAAKQLDAEAVELAVAAHIRHRETNYDNLLVKGYDRWEARNKVGLRVERVLSDWRET